MRRSRSILLEKEAQQAQVNISVYNKITKNRKLLDLEDYFQTRDDRPIDAPFFHVRTHNITSLAKYGHTHPTIKEYDDTTEVTGIRRQNQSPVSIITKVVELEADSTSRRDGHTDYRRKTVVSSHLSQILDGNMQISQQKVSFTMLQIQYFELPKIAVIKFKAKVE